MQVHSKCHMFDGTRRVRPWLYTIATNQAIDIQRRNKRHQLVSLDRPHKSAHAEVGTLMGLLESGDLARARNSTCGSGLSGSAMPWRPSQSSFRRPFVWSISAE